MPKPTLTAEIEAVLFVATEPVSAKRLAEATSKPLADVQAALDELAQQKQGGIVLSELGGNYRLVSSPATAATVKRFMQDETHSELSRPALETLAIVAYRGPVTKAEIERIRGVASETMIRNLTARGLIISAGKSPEAGHPAQYAVSHTFMQHFGLTGPGDLPPLPETSA